MRTKPFAALVALMISCRSHIEAPKQITSQLIDRHVLVSRHDVIIHQPDLFGAMAVGNGNFAFNFDVTALQTFPDYYAKSTPLGTLSTWGWHSFPNPDHYSLDAFPFNTILKHDRTFSFPGSSTAHPTTQAAYLRSNPHRFGLGQIGLIMTKADGSPVAISDLQNINLQLNLWDGQASSDFTVEGAPVRVQTAAHPNRDEVAIQIDSPLIASGRLKLRLAFPYASNSFGPDYQDWNHPNAHETQMAPLSATSADFARTLDDTHYTVCTQWSSGASLAPATKHEFILTGKNNHLEFTASFASQSQNTRPDSVGAVQVAAANSWHRYWNTGGVIDFSKTADPRAAELERRLVLSQYLMAVHDAGTCPPQETGLAANSWYGKFHMEMYWWHAAHWALWGHPELLERSLDSLHTMMPASAEMAKREQCLGVKWPKMTDPAGIESPSGVGPVLVWQQPHPIYLAELLWRARRNQATLDRFKDIVFQTADYMATFVDYDPQRKEYVLGPGVSAGDEKHTDILHNLNPTMEIAYWKWTLQIAQQWRERLHLPRNARWDDVIQHFAKPIARNGIYPALEIPEEEKPAFLTTFMYGAFVSPDVDVEVMRKTLHANHPAAPQNAVTWGTAMAAMCATRLGEPDRAIDLLVGAYDENPFRASGYTVRRPDQTPMYMPANGGWLTAAAMMAAGWDGNTTANPGFPKSWVVRSEGLLPLP